METCLTLVRHEYSESQRIQGFIDGHAALDKSGLTNKVLGQMMLKCTDEISQAQIDQIVPFKQDPASLNTSSLLNLIEIDWEALTELALPDSPEAQQQIRLTPQEQRMTAEVEELSDEMRRDAEDEMRQSMGKTTVAFFNLENMSLWQEIAYLVFILGFFAVLAGVFYKLLFVPEEDPIKKKRQELAAKRKAK